MQLICSDIQGLKGGIGRTQHTPNAAVINFSDTDAISWNAVKDAKRQNLML